MFTYFLTFFTFYSVIEIFVAVQPQAQYGRQDQIPKD